MISTKLSLSSALVLLSSLLAGSAAFTVPSAPAATKASISLAATENDESIGRRSFLTSAAAVLPAAALFAPQMAFAADAKSLIQDVEAARQKLEAIPDFLANSEWDQVRTILKTPPVNYLWNMGDSRNPILQLAQATDEFELIDMKDEVAISLQMCDQLTYDNVFLPYQPGNGKIKIKEPTDLALQAMKQIDAALKVAKGTE